MSDNDLKTRFFGRSVWKTLLQLAVACLIVGAVLVFLGLSPMNFWRGVFDGAWNFISFIGDSFGEIVGNLAKYLVAGAVIVIPVWLILRLLSGRRSRK